MPYQWEIEDDWAVLHIYLMVGAYVSEDDEAVVDLRDGMGGSTRTSIVRRVMNFAYLDTGEGLENSARQTRQVWAEYDNDPDSGVEKARAAYEGITGTEL